MTPSRSSSASGSRLLAAVVLSACVGLIGGGLAAWGVYAHFGPVERVITETRGTTGTVSVGDIAATVQVSVVTVSTQRASAQALATGAANGLAEGFVVSSDGLILTSARAVRGATRLRVAVADGHAFDATVAASSPATGLVLLRAAGASGLTALRLAAQPPRIGDLAVVVSRPALGPLVARSGVVSAVGVTAGDGTTAVADLLAVDATTAAGAEGAPLVDGTGAVIGVVSELPGSAGVVAASGRDAATLIASLPGQGATGTFGVVTAAIGASTAAAAGLPMGALVQVVDPTGPAAGLVQPGDIVTAVDGTAVGSGGLSPAAFGLQAGQSATLTVIDPGGRTRIVTLVVAAA